MIKFKAPIFKEALGTFGAWAAELRGNSFVTAEDVLRLEYNPKVWASGSMTVSSLKTNIAEYFVIEDLVYLFIDISFTTGGVASTSIYINLPLIADKKHYTYNSNVGCSVTDSSDISGQAQLNNKDSLIVRKYDGSNWGLGTSRKVRISGCYVANTRIE